jgi:protein-S-isoprenylcysteine O-methyltransferase Ste14
MAVNKFFEPTVRIQKARGHKLVAVDHYMIVIHHRYVAALAYIISIPMILGSVFKFVPTGVYTSLIILRTSPEDRTLLKKLIGYGEYPKRVRYRMFPWLWWCNGARKAFKMMRGV